MAQNYTYTVAEQNSFDVPSSVDGPGIWGTYASGDKLRYIPISSSIGWDYRWAPCRWRTQPLYERLRDIADDTRYSQRERDIAAFFHQCGSCAQEADLAGVHVPKIFLLERTFWEIFLYCACAYAELVYGGVSASEILGSVFRAFGIPRNKFCDTKIFGSFRTFKKILDVIFFYDIFSQAFATPLAAGGADHHTTTYTDGTTRYPASSGFYFGNDVVVDRATPTIHAYAMDDQQEIPIIKFFTSRLAWFFALCDAKTAATLRECGVSFTHHYGVATGYLANPNNNLYLSDLEILSCIYTSKSIVDMKKLIRSLLRTNLVSYYAYPTVGVDTYQIRPTKKIYPRQLRIKNFPRYSVQILNDLSGFYSYTLNFVSNLKLNPEYGWFRARKDVGSTITYTVWCGHVHPGTAEHARVRQKYYENFGVSLSPSKPIVKEIITSTLRGNPTNIIYCVSSNGSLLTASGVGGARRLIGPTLIDFDVYGDYNIITGSLDSNRSSFDYGTYNYQYSCFVREGSEISLGTAAASVSTHLVRKTGGSTDYDRQFTETHGWRFEHIQAAGDKRLKKDVSITGGTDKIIIRDRNQEAIYKNGPSFRGDEIGIKKKFFFNKNYVHSMAHDVVASRELIIKYDRDSAELLDWEGLWVYTNSPMVAPGIGWVPVERVSLWPFLDGDINQYNYAIY